MTLKTGTLEGLWMTARDDLTEPPVDVRCFPSEDTEFASFVVSIVEDLVGSVPQQTQHFGDDRLIPWVERRLREAYPKATIRRRDVLADFGITARELWYAFRDGTVS